MTYLSRGFSVFGCVTGPSIVYVFQTLKEAEHNATTGNGVAEDVACDALMWLYQMTSNPPTKNDILESLGCLSEMVSDRLEVVGDDLMHALREAIRQSDTSFTRTILPGQERRAERLLRALRDPSIAYHKYLNDWHSVPSEFLAWLLSDLSLSLQSSLVFKYHVFDESFAIRLEQACERASCSHSPLCITLLVYSNTILSFFLQILSLPRGRRVHKPFCIEKLSPGGVSSLHESPLHESTTPLRFVSGFGVRRA